MVLTLLQLLVLYMVQAAVEVFITAITLPALKAFVYQRL